MVSDNPELRAKLSLLNFIEETDQFALRIAMLEKWHGRAYVVELGFVATLEVDKAYINENLKYFGGIKHTFTEGAGAPEIDITLTDWLGRDPEQPGKYKWVGVAAARGGGEFTFDTSVIEEMRQKLRVDTEF
jgi:hypothetical protein